MKKSLIIRKKITLAIVSFIVIVTLFGIQSCEPDQILITDTDLKLPPVPLNTAGWTVVDFTSQEDNDGEGAGNGRVFNTIDGDPDTFWHTCWNGCTAVPPHSFVIDMLESRDISGFNFVQRKSFSRNIEILSIDISEDNSSWTSLGEFTLERTENAEAQDKPLEEVVKARYFRVNVVKVYDGTNNAALAEIAPYL
ncbi:discoidin domain-containing protein [uncultured Polaribacter sp.]|uniref:discoidin domain-containing protein n=1 Tax=uncultured Polaribacter sp. TaxID=174711 RepID=UPI00262DFF18|nr:discoidin domain-containing protein [uncultured Polaribacter sp.]